LQRPAVAAFAAGALRFDVDKEVQRSNFYVLIETWSNRADQGDDRVVRRKSDRPFVAI
jgi:hypothetical protein